MEKLTVNLTGEQKELILRMGDAEKISYAKSINITGILAAPSQFRSGKDLDPTKCHIQIKKDAGVIALHILDTDPHSGSCITGQLKQDGYFAQWQINSEKRWTVSQFVKHIKMHKSFFTNGKECDDLARSLQTWNAKIETVIKEHNDTSGNSLSMLERKVSQVELITKFSLTIPIFQGYPKQTFAVDIGLDPKQNAVELYLFSNDLFSLEINHRDSLIESELAKFEDFPCSKVVLS
jgi:hypothetical protein